MSHGPNLAKFDEGRLMQVLVAPRGVREGHHDCGEKQHGDFQSAARRNEI